MMMEIMVSCRWRRWAWCPEDGDQRSKMILAISCHYLIACDVYHVFASYLLRTTVVSKMIPYNNFKKVVPLTVHCCEGSLFRSTTWWSGVISSTSIYNGCKPVLHTQNTQVKLDEPSMYRHGLGTHAIHLGWLDEPSMYRHGLGTRRTERSSMSRIEDTINMEMFTDLD